MRKLMIISGGSRGLGLSLLRQALQDDWQVLEISRQGAALEAVGMQHLKMDLADPGASFVTFESEMAQLAGQDWQQVVLVNNAGMVGPIAPVAQLDDASVQQNVAVNFASGLRIMAAFVRHFQANSAKKLLISVSSGAALKGYPSWSLYCGAKAGLENFVRTVALEQDDQPHPICCVNFGPGVIDTDMQAEIRSAPPEKFRDVAQFREMKERQALRSPESVAQALLRLINGDAENGRRYVVNEFDA